MASKEVEYATVQVAQGTLRGQKVTKNGNNFYSFQGIPYAKPPIGPLRFKPPQPAEPWQGSRDALKEGPSSAQIDFILKTPFLGEEDCLFLNVYSSKLPEGSKTTKIPVMVFFHGGAFVGGSGNTEMYGPAYLVPEVVLVTVNYRLGALGFLSLVDASVPGNNGLKDQAAALRWIKQNIASFGGDPNNVTIFGESAGGASVNYHVLSPMSKGLFHKGIAQSGSVLNPWALCTPEQARERAQRLGKTLGCDTTDQKELLKFLQTVSAKDIVEASPKMMTEEDKKTFTLAFFLPVPEIKGGSDEEVFLPDYPINLLKEGKFNHVPYMTGITNAEGIVFMSDVLANPDTVKVLDENFYYLLPAEFRKKGKEIVPEIKKHYFGGENLSQSNLPKLVNFFTHTWFLNGIQETINYLVSKSSKPVYYYLFEFVGELNFYKKFLKAESLPGASHIDDLGYLFRMDVMDIDVQPQSPTYNMVRKMVKLWSNFARTGNPTPNLDSDVNVAWPAYTQSNGKYFRINSDLRADENLLINDVKFWNKIQREK
ncbi:hypothetical protein R5R35_000299 [Gryllus longicercus]|uniref:Carboxylic ester hydrolase n=1 Tax=Gryllus longicercus TaxID=2509291 RepID=A0AAN9Z958_9ORTH